MKKTMENQDWYVYMIQTKSGSLYTGISKDVDRRFQEHASGKGAKYFFMDPPRKIVWKSKQMTKSGALKKEIALKKLDSNAKKDFINDIHHC